MYSIVMSNGNSNTKQILSAVAVILAKSKLDYNKNGKPQVRLKIVLGQKSSIINDTNPFQAKEIINATATDINAIYIDEILHPSDEVSFSAHFLSNSKKPSLKITEISIK
jgi:hypothetical protein